MSADPEVVIEQPVADEQVAAFTQTVHRMWLGVSSLLRDLGVEPPAARVVATSDVMGTAAREGARMGLPPDRGKGAERVGGTVAGKCLLSDDGRRGVVIVPGEVAAAVDGVDRFTTAGTLGHEMGHLVYGSVRNSAVGPTSDVWLPWEVAEVVAIIAAEEYRVDRIGQVLAEVVLRPTDGAGNPVALAAIVGRGYRAGLAAALEEVVPGLQEDIWTYRLRGTPLDELWHSIARVSEGIAIYLAHTEAYSDNGQLAVEGEAHRAAGLLEPLWRPLFHHLTSTPVLPQRADWREDRRRLRDIGRDGFTEVWRRLGLAARPEGDTFYLSVGDPSWP